MRPAPLTPAYRDMNAFSYTLAMIYESLRLRDLVMTLPKLVAEDVIIPYTPGTPWETSPSVPG